MKKFIISLIIFTLLLFSRVNAFQIVYPSSANVKVDSPVTAFIGNEKNSESLTINGEKVKLHFSGGFRHPVKLNYGENTFSVSNGIETKIYTITRRNNAKAPTESDFKEFINPIIVSTAGNNVPLRSTPVNEGLNRLQHFQQGVLLKVIGEYGDFYKVQLTKKEYAWISKTDTVAAFEPECGCTSINFTEYISNDKEDIFIFKLQKKVPYILSETDNGFELAIYGLNEEIYPLGKYEFHISKNNKKFGYSAKYNENNELVIKINKFIPELKNITITIDPGHGGTEIGTTGCLGDREKDFNLKFAKKLKIKLNEAGANIVMTRDSDKNVTLQDRVKIANDNSSQIFISIHANALPDSLLNKKISGTEVYYFYPQSKELAFKILNSINENTGNSGGKIQAQSFAVVRNTEAICILLEIGYMIDPDENFKLIDEDYQNKVINGIISGLGRYLDDI